MEMPAASWSGETHDKESKRKLSTSETISKAIKDIEDLGPKESRTEEDNKELAIFRRVQTALEAAGGSRQAAADWLRDQMKTTKRDPEELVAAAVWLENFQD